MWGDQWECRCGWSNFIVRKKCRNCGADQPVPPQIKSWREVMTDLGKEQRNTSDPQ